MLEAKQVILVHLKKGNENRAAFISSTSRQHFTYLFNVLYNLKNVFRSAFSNTAAQQKYLGALQNHNSQEVPPNQYIRMTADEISPGDSNVQPSLRTGVLELIIPILQ